MKRIALASMAALAVMFNGGQPLGNRTAPPRTHEYDRGKALKKAKRLARKSAQRRNRK